MNVLMRLIEDSGLKNKKFVDVLQISHATWQKKKENPEILSIVEVRQLAALLRMSPEALFNEILKDTQNKNENQ